MTTGFTNGSKNGGKIAAGYVCYVNAYGTPVGSTGSGTGVGSGSIGITTQSAYSGIITEAHSHTLTTLQCGTWIIKYA